MFKRLLNTLGEVTDTDRPGSLDIRRAALRVAKLVVTVLLGWTILKGTVAMLPGLFIVAVGYLLIWKLAK